MTCECESGAYNCSCCCASVTGLRGGIHPDYIKSAWVDLVIDQSTEGDRTFNVAPIVTEPIHIVSVTASLACTKRDHTDGSAAAEDQLEQPEADVADSYGRSNTPAMFSLFTSTNWSKASGLISGGFFADEDEIDGRDYCATGAVTAQAPSWTGPPDLFGYFCDGGLFVEFNAPSHEYGVRLAVNYVKRAAFSPAYGDPVKVLQHYWKCAHGTEVPFLDGFYGGVTHEITSSGTIGSSDSTALTSGAANPLWSVGTNITGIIDE